MLPLWGALHARHLFMASLSDCNELTRSLNRFFRPPKVTDNTGNLTDDR
jgi:hypothetical protein